MKKLGWNGALTFAHLGVQMSTVRFVVVICLAPLAASLVSIWAGIIPFSTWLDIPAGNPIFRAYAQSPTSVWSSPDGSMLVSRSRNGNELYLWDTASRSKREFLSGFKGIERSVAFSHDSRKIAASGNDGSIYLWNVRKGTAVALTGHHSYVGGLTFSGDGKLLASASDDMTVKLWDVDTGRELATLRGHTARVRSVAFSPDGRHLGSAGDDHFGRLWDVRLCKLLASLPDCPGYATELAFSPDGTVLAAAGCFKEVILWDLANGAKLPLDFPKWYGASDMFFCKIAFAPDDKTMAIVTNEFVGLWNIKTGKTIAKYDAPTTECAFESVFFADNGSIFAAGKDAKSVMIWRITTLAH